MGEVITIDIYADVVCPWCYIGLKRLEKALEQKSELKPVRQWQPFQLRPEMPEGGQDWLSFADEKFGGRANAQAAFAQVTRLGLQEGIDFRFDRIASAPNTAQAHRLIFLAREHGQEWAMAEALFRAYFSEGYDLNKLEHLLLISKGLGLNQVTVTSYLQGNQGMTTVLESQQTAVHYGISGVPFYIIRQGDKRYGVSGAQAPEVFLKVFSQLESEVL